MFCGCESQERRVEVEGQILSLDREEKARFELNRRSSKKVKPVGLYP